MCRVVFVALVLVVGPRYVEAPPPVRLTIDCGSKEKDSLGWKPRPNYDRNYDVDSFCDLLHNAIPKAIQDGKVIFLSPDEDQNGFGNTHVPISLPPPEGFVPKIELPKFRTSKLRIPKIKVPNLGLSIDKTLSAPIVGAPMAFPTFRDLEEDSSAEKMEKFKKGVRKMLHFVKVLGQVDQYLSERTRIIVDKLSKTFAE